MSDQEPLIRWKDTTRLPVLSVLLQESEQANLDRRVQVQGRFIQQENPTGTFSKDGSQQKRLSPARSTEAERKIPPAIEDDSFHLLPGLRTQSDPPLEPAVLRSLHLSNR
ncbi:hypothetical protein A4R35_01005 [Thermogemmatispora tikiterensis]|uniref:Uncharacterized protein n=1 Tax=Thermogemmatispora tikiterensis TaxID=1825093 RepID=A0A328VEA5_9CHLR|nr:hypothetical protein A4R35_01005 [Thermogemmatispora tikiterensis]